MSLALEIRELSKRYGRTSALHGVSLSVAVGETIALVGPNGAGKSTLMKAIAGAVRPSSGEIVLPANDAGRSPGERLGFVFDPDGIPPGMSPRRALNYEARVAGVGDDRVARAVTEYDLGGFAKRKVSKLSTGQRKRTALAAATLADPALLLLDEPSSGLDIEGIRWLRRMVEQRASAGLTTIISSHNLTELQIMASRVVVLKQTVRFDGPFASFATGGQAEMEERYFSLVDDSEVRS